MCFCPGINGGCGASRVVQSPQEFVVVDVVARLREDIINENSSPGRMVEALVEESLCIVGACQLTALDEVPKSTMFEICKSKLWDLAFHRVDRRLRHDSLSNELDASLPFPAVSILLDAVAPKVLVRDILFCSKSRCPIFIKIENVTSVVDINKCLACICDCGLQDQAIRLDIHSVPVFFGDHSAGGLAQQIIPSTLILMLKNLLVVSDLSCGVFFKNFGNDFTFSSENRFVYFRVKDSFLLQ